MAFFGEGKSLPLEFLSNSAWLFANLTNNRQGKNIFVTSYKVPRTTRIKFTTLNTNNVKINGMTVLIGGWVGGVNLPLECRLGFVRILKHQQTLENAKNGFCISLSSVDNNDEMFYNIGYKKIGVIF